MTINWKRAELIAHSRKLSSCDRYMRRCVTKISTKCDLNEEVFKLRIRELARIERRQAAGIQKSKPSEFVISTVCRLQVSVCAEFESGKEIVTQKRGTSKLIYIHCAMHVTQENEWNPIKLFMTENKNIHGTEEITSNFQRIER